MIRLKFVLFYSLAALLLANTQGQDLRCSAKFCKLYTNQNDCPPYPDTCDEQTGELFKGEVPCGCCNVCIEYLGENEFCSVGSPDLPPPNKICGPRLTCKQIGNEYRCRTMDTDCFKEWKEYNKTIAENRVLKYMDKPICDGDGNYGPIKCNVGQTCFCVNKDGERIFGESTYSEATKLAMTCDCSRMNHKFNQMIKFKYPGLTSRCLGDGSYDPLQCLSDKCICVERESGAQSDENVYNLTKVVYKDIPCYDRNWHFDWTYLSDCEESYMKYLDDVHEALSEGRQPLHLAIQQCQPDGWYTPIKEDSKFKFCVDKYNIPMKMYTVPKDSPEAKLMNCKCARTQELLIKNKMEFPECCPNGNFKKIQCRNVDNINKDCYCVDEDGLQIEKEVDIDEISSLSCYADRDIC